MLLNLKNKIQDWEQQQFKGNLITIQPLLPSHLSSLEKQFSPALFEFYPYKYTDCQNFIDSVLKLKETGDFFPWIFIDNKSQECVGSSSFSSISSENKRLEIGWTWFGPDYQTKGYNVESKLLLLEFLFEKEGFHRAELKADALNIKSNLAMQKLGFVKEGIFRRHMIMPSGRIRDSVYYSVVFDEWPQTKAHILKRLEGKMRSTAT